MTKKVSDNSKPATRILPGPHGQSTATPLKPSDTEETPLCQQCLHQTNAQTIITPTAITKAHHMPHPALQSPQCFWKGLHCQRQTKPTDILPKYTKKQQRRYLNSSATHTQQQMPMLSLPSHNNKKELDTTANFPKIKHAAKNTMSHNNFYLTFFQDLWLH